MSDQKKLADLLHLRGQGLSKGDPIAPPLVSSSMFHLPGAPDGFAAYGRVDNPTWDVVEHMLSHLEEAPCVAFPSGMGAISAALFATVRAGDRVLIPSDGYYVTRVLAREFLAGLGVDVVEKPTRDYDREDMAGYQVVFIETPSNPGLDLCDLAAVAQRVRASGGISIVDNTTMTALGQRPLDLGADIIVASDTKAPGGHSDLLMGHVATRNDALLNRVRDWRKMSGAIPAPQAAWLLHRGLETLEVRFDRMCHSAGKIAAALRSHPALSDLCYPGLEDHPSHALAQRQMTRFGFLVTLTLADEDSAERFINGCDLLRPATSFGGVHSSAERRARWGDAVPAGFVRLSVGCEPTEALLEALKTSLDKL
ncbi:cystathionine gamma-lyase [Aliiroseovarius crassostreae]|uniref:cystathionine gamma-lyase n=1 Tax=Aliiroseovarius crassostreae TaxID=154981 RepID=UPI0021AEF6F3|nr:cystathionine gamma-lyase [Aliiroseovarius crassostreae]UWQ09155.1 cystathionine gamma-lyase [Aliiroseovarius crassostreae]UWQ12233.1 cystathionine gamma-lyase [Aliiroseovarius crassostreae]